MGTVEVEQAIWKKIHENRYEHVEQARRARDAQADLARMGEVLEEYSDEVLYLRRVLENRSE